MRSANSDTNSLRWLSLSSCQCRPSARLAVSLKSNSDSACCLIAALRSAALASDLRFGSCSTAITWSTEAFSWSVGAPAHACAHPRRQRRQIAVATAGCCRKEEESRLARTGSSTPEDVNIDHARALAVPLGEQDRLRSLQRQSAVGNSDRHSVSEQGCPEMCRGVAPLAVRPAQVVMTGGTTLVDDVPHEPDKMVDAFTCRLRDDHRAGRMQAVRDHQAVLHPRALDGFLDLGPEINGLTAGLGRDREALPVHEQACHLGLSSPHGSFLF